MVEVYDLRYPVCKICGEGVLLPFFWKDGRNVYFCSNCGAKFTGLNKEPEEEGEPVFLDKAIYMNTSTVVGEQDRADGEDEEIDDIFEIPEKPDEEAITAEDILKEEVEFHVEEESTESEEEIEELSGEEVVEENEEEPKEDDVEEEDAEKDEVEPEEDENDDIPKDEKAYEKYLAKYIDKEDG